MIHGIELYIITAMKCTIYTCFGVMCETTITKPEAAWMLGAFE